MKTRAYVRNLSFFGTLIALTAARAVAIPDTAQAVVTSTWDGNALPGNWTDAFRWSPSATYPDNGQPLPADTYNAVVPTNSFVVLNQDIEIEAYTQAGTAILDNAPNPYRTLTVNGLFNWTGGEIQGRVIIDAQGNIDINGATIKRMDVFNSGAIPQINNHGALTWTGGGVNSTVVSDMFGIYYATLNNLPGATFSAQPNSFFNVQINNQGTFTRSVGTGIEVHRAPFNNSGTANINTGTLELATGGTSTGDFIVASGAKIYFNGHNLQAGSSVTGAGTVQFSNPSSGGSFGVDTLVAGDYNVTATVLDNRLQFNTAGTTGILTVNNTTGVAMGGTGTLTATGVTTYQAGIFNGDVTINAQGGLNITASFSIPSFRGNSVLNLAGGTSTWTGTTTLIEVIDNAQMNVLSGAVFNVSDSFGTREITNHVINPLTPGTFSNAGTLNKRGAGSTLRVEIPATNTGLMNIQGGTLAFTSTPGFSLTQTGADAEIRLSGGTLSGELDLQDGYLTGSGNVQSFVASTGTISPGLSAGTLNFQNDLLLDGGYLEMEIGGLTAGTQHDKINVTGELTLGGILNVFLIDDFEPAEGDFFDLLDWGTSSAFFDDVFLPSLDGGLEWDLDDLYSDGILRIAGGSPGVLGDFDDDSDVDATDIDILADILFRGASDPGGDDDPDLNGVGGATQDDMDYMVNTILETVFGDADLDDDVDGADFDAWRIRDSLGGGIGWATGDWDGDNDVDGADFDHWRLRLPAIGGAGGVAAVPEPATLISAFLGALSVLVTRRLRAAR